jgi:uncharacterized zinc-type alcohol dehydrogenase-like protein
MEKMNMINAYAALEPKGNLEPFEYDPGVLAVDDVEIDVKFCGICHSDLSMIDSGWMPTRYPIVAGHEVSGVIAAIGDNVTGFELGQAVGLGWHSGYCDECHYCGIGDHNLCSKTKPTIIGRHGGFADKVRASASSVVALPEGMDMASAGPLFCGGITVYNPLKQFNIKPTDKVAVIGIGGLGHMALQFLNAWGCEVTAFTSTDSKRQEALEMGAHDTINSKDSSALKSASNRFDMIISTVNVTLDWTGYLGTLAPRGRLHFVGMVTEPLSVGVSSLMSKQLSVSSSPIGSPTTIAEMLEFANRHNIKPVTETYAFKDINKAVQRLRSGKARYRVVLAHE